MTFEQRYKIWKKKEEEEEKKKTLVVYYSYANVYSLNEKGVTLGIQHIIIVFGVLSPSGGKPLFVL